MDQNKINPFLFLKNEYSDALRIYSFPKSTRLLSSKAKLEGKLTFSKNNVIH